MNDITMGAATPANAVFHPELFNFNQTDFSYLFHLSPLGAMVTDSDNQILYVNPTFERLTGYAADEAVGQTPALLQSSRHDGEFYKSMWHSLLTGGSWQGEIWNRKKSGIIYPEMLTINRLVDIRTGSVSYLGLFFDMTQKKQTEEILDYEANHDMLTGLANNTCMRRHLDTVLTRARNQLRSIAVLYIDLDGFKSVNDSRGHLEGDCVLKSFAQKLKASVRESDFVARVGGDEFVVVLDMVGSGEEAAYDVAEKILATIKSPVEEENSHTQVGCSIGISVFPCNGESVNELLNAADMAMYKVKRQGGGYLYNLTRKWFRPECEIEVNYPPRVRPRPASFY